MNIFYATNAIIAYLPGAVEQYDREIMNNERNKRKGYYHELSTETMPPWTFNGCMFLVYPDGRIIIQSESEYIQDLSFIYGCDASEAYKAWKSNHPQEDIALLLKNYDLREYRLERTPPTPDADDYLTRYAIGELVAISNHPGKIGQVLGASGLHETRVGSSKPGGTYYTSGNEPTKNLRRLSPREVYDMWDVLGDSHSASRIATINLSVNGEAEQTDIYRDVNGMLILIPIGWVQQCAGTDDEGRICCVDAFGSPKVPTIVTLDGPDDLAEITIEIIEDKVNTRKEPVRQNNLIFETDGIPF